MQRTPGIRFAAITQAVAGTMTPVAGVAGKKIVVLSYALTLSAAGTAKFQSNTTDISGAMDFAAQGGSVAVAAATDGLLETAPGEDLRIITTGGAGKGHLTYCLVEA